MRTLVRPLLVLVCMTRAILAASGPADSKADHAFYLMSTSAEGQEPPVKCVHLCVTAREELDGKQKAWWELAGLGRDGRTWGVRILSDRPAMTSREGVGRIERYIYRDADGRVCEYRDAATGKALLPPIQFEQSFLPRPSSDAVFRDGFASAGAFLGHVLVRTQPVEPPPRVSFENARVLDMRTDLLIGTQACVRTDHLPPPTDGSEPKQRAWTRDEYGKMIAAGMNYFDVGGENAWLLHEPVFFRMPPAFPDTYYRSNWVPGQMFIDEPSVRLGWSGGIPANPTNPEQVAEALRQRVASHYVLKNRKLGTDSATGTGTLDLIAKPAVSWDTDYWSAWYQYAAGAPAVVHEGRYVNRGYGWEPEALYGPEGLDGLTLRDQVNCLNAFLRGAARAFGGDWGVSVYPEGEPPLRLPALTQAYDMGAKHLWFWTYPPLTYGVETELCKGIAAHIREHPRDLAQANRAAKVGIAFPPGHVFSWQGTWGMQREQRSVGGASYGDISAAGMWEGILCSRQGIPFDFLVDDPRIRDLGYERLITVGIDGSLAVDPPWKQPRAAASLNLELQSEPVLDIASRASGLTPEYTVRRAARIAVDGDLSEWNAGEWIHLAPDVNGFPDGVTIETTVLNDISQERWRANFTSYMGMTFRQIDEELEKKYVLEDLHGRGVAVTGLESGSPADKAGVREGDVLVWVLNRQLDWQFQMYERLQHIKNTHDKMPVRLVIRRSGRYDFGSPGDLDAKIAMTIDDRNLYLAARVTDNEHFQPYHDSDYWKADSLQIGLDPTLERRPADYGEQDHEFGLVLAGNRAFAWRYHGRRGQALGEMPEAEVRIVREKGQTSYEAAIPLAGFAPLAPDLWPLAGFNIVVNDSDGRLQRKGRLELKPKAMTLGKKPQQYAILAFAPSRSRQKLSAAIVWQRRATPENGNFRLVIAACSPESTHARVQAELHSLGSPETAPAQTALDLPVTSEPREHSLLVRTGSPFGRYDLDVRVIDDAGEIVTRDRQPVYVYPVTRD